jgi:putative ABC transport system permease protein
MQNIHLGDAVELGTPSGLVRLVVAGVHVDYTDQQGSILVDRSLYLRYWKDDSVDVFRVYLKPGPRQEEARQTILAEFGGHGALFVMSSAELKKYILRATDQWFALTYVQLAIAVGVAILGIVNSLTVSVIDRRRELAVLQAVGGLRSQVRQCIWIEAGVLGLLGVILGTAVGSAMLWFNVYLTRLDSFGYRFEYLYPYGFAGLLVPVILGSAFLASLWPAELAVRGSLIEALEYE